MGKISSFFHFFFTCAQKKGGRSHRSHRRWRKKRHFNEDAPICENMRIDYAHTHTRTHTKYGCKAFFDRYLVQKARALAGCRTSSFIERSSKTTVRKTCARSTCLMMLTDNLSLTGKHWLLSCVFLLLLLSCCMHCHYVSFACPLISSVPCMYARA